VLLAPGLAAIPEAAERLLARLGRQDFENWIGKLAVAGIEGSVVTLSAPSTFARDWIAARWLDALAESFRAAGLSVARVELTVRK
jgi:chromosomal replication initiation ATPase DnaA